MPKPWGRQGHHSDAGKVIPLARRALAPPPAPKNWLALTVAGWQDYWTSDMARALHPGQTDAALRLFTYRDEWQRSMTAYRKTPLVAGSTGQARLSPCFEAAMKLEDRIERLEADLGMTPYAFMRLGIATDQAARTIEDLMAETEAYDDEDENDPLAGLGERIAVARTPGHGLR